MNFEAVWKSVENEQLQGTATGIVRRRVLPDACCDFFLGVEKPSKRRVFLLRVASSCLPQTKLLPQARGFEVRLLTMPDDPSGHASVLLLQTTDAFRDIFTTLAADVASYIAPTKDHGAAVEKLLARLKRWQQFLERSGPEGLSAEAQRGLFGELWFMRQFLIPARGKESVEAWTGPAMAAQDFQLPGVAVEVKTTTAKEHQKLPIAGEKQLDNTDQLRIILLHLSLTTQRETGITLVELIASLRALLASAPNALLIFDDGLLAAGYLDMHAYRYAHLGYQVREHHFFEVRDAFPRIVGADLRDGVGDVSYSISVAACLHYVISETDFLKILHTGVA